MGVLLENIYDLLVKPKTALNDIAETKTLGQALQIFLLSIILASLGAYAGTFEGSAKIFVIVLQIISSIFIWGVSTAIWHLLAELLGGDGSVKKLLTTTGFIYFLQILVVPIYLLAAIFPESGVALISIATIIIAIWSISLQVIAISIVYKISIAKACLILFLPILIFISLITIIAFTVGSILMSTANQFLVNPPQF